MIFSQSLQSIVALSHVWPVAGNTPVVSSSVFVSPFKMTVTVVVPWPVSVQVGGIVATVLEVASNLRRVFWV